MESRLSAHQQGKGGYYTSRFLAVELVYVDLCGSRAEAIINERKIKSWSRAKKEAFIKQNEAKFVRVCREQEANKKFCDALES